MNTDLGKFIHEVVTILSDEMGDFGFLPHHAQIHVNNNIERVIERFKSMHLPKPQSFEKAVRETAWSVMFAVVVTMQKKEGFGR